MTEANISDGKQPEKQSESQTGLSAEDKARLGLSVRTVGGKVEAYFHAGGADQIVTPEGGGSLNASAAQKILEDQMTALEKKYSVHFVPPGEEAGKQMIYTSDCSRAAGDVVHSKLPTFSDVYATAEALEHSTPSQLTADGKDGMNIYFVDKNLFAQNAYGSKPALGLYMPGDRKGHAALYIMPEGDKVPPTERDTKDSQERNLAYILEHEITHNSQKNNWQPTYPFLPDKLPESFGWQTINRIEKDGQIIHENYILKGQNGEFYANSRLTCGAPNTSWIAIKDNKWIGKDGQPTDDMTRVKEYSNDEVSHNAMVKPPTYYFPNPTEMMAEGLAKYRSSENTRRRLFQTSPELYNAVQKYDRDEINRVYGLDNEGQGKFVRSPQGIVVPKDSRSTEALRSFDQSLTPGSFERLKNALGFGR